MTQKIEKSQRALDPWIASSLLQKSIRRGETELALRAAYALLGSRGRNVWRRLVVIAFEDVGIGNLDAIRSTLDTAERHLSARNQNLSDGLDATVSSLCASDKNRGTDHLTCAAIHYQASTTVNPPTDLTDEVVIDLVSDPSRSIIRRAAVLLNCGFDTTPLGIARLARRLEVLRATMAGAPREALELSLRGLAVLKGSFVATLPLLASERGELREASSVVLEPPPLLEWVDGVPSYAFDKHTSAGKRALAKIANSSSDIRHVLSQFVEPSRYVDVVCMAAFHTDAVPLDRKLIWPGSDELERAGLEADMLKAGCPPCGVDSIMETIGLNLEQINAERVAVYGRK